MVLEDQSILLGGNRQGLMSQTSKVNEVLSGLSKQLDHLNSLDKEPIEININISIKYARDKKDKSSRCEDCLTKIETSQLRTLTESFGHVQ